MMGAAALLCVASLFSAVDGIALDDSTIRTAVAAWLSDSAAAEATYGHISAWETAGVTDMSYLFCGSSYDYSGYGYCNTAAASFNEDIGAWDTSGVTTMYMMFYDASAFDQDLGWCVADEVELGHAFYGTLCRSSSCGVRQVEGGCAPSPAPTTTPVPTVTPAPTVTPLVADDGTIRTAVAAWLADRTAAEATYGPISRWETGGVTDMEHLFCAALEYPCNSGAASFNDDIGAWDTSGVTTMYRMFYQASSFNQDISGWAVDRVTSMHLMFAWASAFNRDIGGWAVQSVTDMAYMFWGASAFDQDIGNWAVHSVRDMNGMFREASAFDQDLGWCVDDDVWLYDAFSNTPCESTSCGVVRCRTKKKEQTPVAVIAGATAAAALLLAVGAFWFYRRRKASMMDKADEPSGASSPEEATSSKEATGPESLETRAAAKAKAAETAERPGFARKLSSFLFGEQEDEPSALTAVAEAEEAPSAEQPPPPTPAEPAAPKAEEIYNQIAAWYNEPANAALRATWGAYPDPEEFQTWPGFVAVTNAFLDREAG